MNQTPSSPESTQTTTPVPAQPATGISNSTTPTGTLNVEQMRDAMKEIFDPEIPINIVDLGLIYKLEEKEGKVDVDMTLTSPHCPVGDQLKARVNEVLIKLNGIKAVNVNLVFDPPWTKEKLTFEGKLQASMLGIM